MTNKEPGVKAHPVVGYCMDIVYEYLSGIKGSPEYEEICENFFVVATNNLLTMYMVRDKIGAKEATEKVKELIDSEFSPAWHQRMDDFVSQFKSPI